MYNDFRYLKQSYSPTIRLSYTMDLDFEDCFGLTKEICENVPECKLTMISVLFQTMRE